MTPVKVPAKRAGGRQRLVKDGDWKFIGCKAPPDLHAEYLALGGSKWLRATLEASLKKRMKTPPAE